MSKAASAVTEADQPAERGSMRARGAKSPGAFRTISEVADDLGVPQHVLRFWEGRFPQVKPLKRGGGRRYYRPEDIALLRRIHALLYVQCYTIKGVQRLLRESGGRLGDDIPPPAPEEKAGLEAGVEARFEADLFDAADEPQLPMPGLGPPLPPPAPPPRPVAPRAPRVSAATVQGESPPPADFAIYQEVALLRSVLRETLAELEALRALLPR
jgi:DNA-binding transcriptional MerR regulator